MASLGKINAAKIFAATVVVDLLFGFADALFHR